MKENECYSTYKELLVGGGGGEGQPKEYEFKENS